MNHAITVIVAALLVLQCCVGPAELHAQTFQYSSLPAGTVSAIMNDKVGNIYLGCGTGVFRSTDKGATWSRYSLSNTYQSLFTSSMCRYRDSLLATASLSSGVRVMEGGAWHERNAGLPSSSGNLPSIRSIVYDSSGNLLVAACKTVFVKGGIYICKDTTWTELESGLDTLNVLSLVVSPSGTVYCGTQGKGVYYLSNNLWHPLSQGLNSLHINTLACSKNGKLYAGTDAGCSYLEHGATTWSNTSLDTQTHLPVLSLSISANDPNRLLASLGNSKEHVGTLFAKVYVSTNGGLSWSETMREQKTLSAQAAFIDADDRYYIGAQAVFCSSNLGQDWTESRSGFRDILSTGSGLVMNSKGILFLATSNGVFRSKDKAHTWEMANDGLTRPQISMLFCDSRDNLYAGAYSGKIGSTLASRMFRSTNNGDSWDSLHISPDDQYCQMAEGPKGTLYCSHGFSTKPGLSEYSPSSLAKSTDFGVTWHDLEVTAGMGYGVAVNKRGHIFHGGETNGPYLSTDGGITWQKDMPIENSGNIVCTISPYDEVFTYSYGPNCIWYSDSASNGHPFINLSSPSFPLYKVPTCFAWAKNNRLYVGTRANGAASGIFYTDYPITKESTFSPVPNFPSSPFVMLWDLDGHLWLQGPNFVAVSDSILGYPRNSTQISGSEVSSSTAFRVQPNPAQDYLHPVFPSTTSQDLEASASLLQIRNVLGVVVGSYTPQSSVDTSIDIRFLSPGVYFLCTENGCAPFVKL